MPDAAAAVLQKLVLRTDGNIADATKLGKLNAYITDVNTKIIDKLILITDNDTFDANFKNLPLIVDYSPRVGGKSRRKNNNKNNKSRRKNQSKRQRK